MVAKNDITGDSIQSKPSSAYADNYDRIFRKTEPVQPELDLGEPEVTTDKLIHCTTCDMALTYSGLADHSCSINL